MLAPSPASLQIETDFVDFNHLPDWQIFPYKPAVDAVLM